jgi:SAM-dependent methyltransferase
MTTKSLSRTSAKRLALKILPSPAIRMLRNGSGSESRGFQRLSRNVRVFSRSLIPPVIYKLKQRVAVRRALRRALEACEGLSVEETFEMIYKKNLWGGKSGEFYSGRGSDVEIADPYCNYVRRFIQENRIKSIVDLGCGDFRVGRRLAVQGTRYLGIDVVSSLIERNTREFGGEGISFQVLNAIDQVPPVGDLCLIRQVLQHLSNEQISAVIRNCRSFRYLLVSEHLILNGSYVINADKPHGPDTRASGIRLDKPPFCCDAETVLEVQIGPDEVIRTVLIAQEAIAPRVVDLKLRDGCRAVNQQDSKL